MTDNYALYTFHSTHHALKFENELRSANITIRIIPVPRQISASCGLAARILIEDLETVKELINRINLEYSELYLIKNQKYIKHDI